MACKTLIKKPLKYIVNQGLIRKFEITTNQTYMTNLSELQGEVWKDIPNEFKGVYQASSLGRIRSLHFGKCRILKGTPDDKGYIKIKLQKKGHLLTTGAHRLVALAFLPNPSNLPEVNHKDGITGNNLPSNLEWCTRLENLIHRNTVLITEEKREAFRLSCRKPERLRKISEATKGAKNGFAKKVIDKTTGEVFGCVGDAATKYGYTYNQLKQWLNGRRKNLSVLEYLKKTG